MKLFLHLFISLAIIVTIAMFSNAGITHSNPLNGMTKLMNEPPPDPSKFESAVSRMRRNVDPKATNADDIPKEELNYGSHLRTRRQAPSEDSNIPKELQKVAEALRVKRQMPSPPGDMPMPPM